MSGGIVRLSTCGTLSILLCCVFGCSTLSMSGGNPIDLKKIAAMHKGVTTRSQVEAMFGQPTSVHMGPNGGHIMSYSQFQLETRAKVTSYIPVVDQFASGTTGEEHYQVLNVLLDKNDVVQDYDYNDRTQKDDSTSGVWGDYMRVTQTPQTQLPSGR